MESKRVDQEAIAPPMWATGQPVSQSAPRASPPQPAYAASQATGLPPASILEAMGVSTDEEGVFSKLLILKPNIADVRPTASRETTVPGTSATLAIAFRGDAGTDAYLQHSTASRDGSDQGDRSKQSQTGLNQQSQSTTQYSQQSHPYYQSGQSQGQISMQQAKAKDQGSGLGLGLEAAAAAARHALEQREANSALREWAAARRTVHESIEKRSEWNQLQTQRMIAHYEEYQRINSSSSTRDKEQPQVGDESQRDSASRAAEQSRTTSSVNGRKAHRLAAAVETLLAQRPPPQRISAAPSVSVLDPDDVAAITLGLSSRRREEDGALRTLRSRQMMSCPEHENQEGVSSSQSLSSYSSAHLLMTNTERPILPSEPVPIGQLRLVIAFARHLTIDPDTPIFARVIAPSAPPPAWSKSGSTSSESSTTIYGPALAGSAGHAHVESSQPTSNPVGPSASASSSSMSTTGSYSLSGIMTQGQNQSAGLNLPGSAIFGEPHVAQTHSVIGRKVIIVSNSADPLRQDNQSARFIVKYISPQNASNESHNLEDSNQDKPTGIFSMLNSPAGEATQADTIWPWLPAELAALPPQTFFHSQDFIRISGESSVEEETDSASEAQENADKGSQPASPQSLSPSSGSKKHRKSLSRDRLGSSDTGGHGFMTKLEESRTKAGNVSSSASAASASSSSSSESEDESSTQSTSDAETTRAESDGEPELSGILDSHHASRWRYDHYGVDFPWEETDDEETGSNADSVTMQPSLRSRSNHHLGVSHVVSRRRNPRDEQTRFQSLSGEDSSDSESESDSRTRTETRTGLKRPPLRSHHRSSRSKRKVAIDQSTIGSDLIPWPENVASQLGVAKSTHADRSGGPQTELTSGSDDEGGAVMPQSRPLSDNENLPQSPEWNDEKTAAVLDAEIGVDDAGDGNSKESPPGTNELLDFHEIFRRIFESPEEEVRDAIRDMAPYVDPALIAALRSIPGQVLSRKFRLNTASEIVSLSNRWTVADVEPSSPHAPADSSLHSPLTDASTNTSATDDEISETDEDARLVGLLERLKQQLLAAHATYHTRGEAYEDEEGEGDHDDGGFRPGFPSNIPGLALSQGPSSKPKSFKLKHWLRSLFVRLNAFEVADRGITTSSKSAIFEHDRVCKRSQVELRGPHIVPSIEARFQAASLAEPIMDLRSLPKGATRAADVIVSSAPATQVEEPSSSGFISDVMGRFRSRERVTPPRYEFLVDIYDVSHDIIIAFYAQADFMRSEKALGRIIIPVSQMLGLTSPLPPSFQWYELLPENQEEEPSLFSQVAMSVGGGAPSAAMSASSQLDVPGRVSQTPGNSAEASSGSQTGANVSLQIGGQNDSTSGGRDSSNDTAMSTGRTNEAGRGTENSSLAVPAEVFDGVGAFQQLKFLASDPRISHSGLPRPARSLGFVCIGTQLKLFAPVFELYAAPKIPNPANLTQVRHFSASFFKRASSRLQTRLLRPPLLAPVLYLWGWVNPKASLLFDALVLFMVAFAPAWAIGPLLAIIFLWLTIISGQTKSVYETSYAYESALAKTKRNTSLAAKLHKTHRTLCKYQSYFEYAASALERLDNLVSWTDPRITAMLHVILFGLSIVWAVLLLCFEFRSILAVVATSILGFPIVARIYSGTFESPLSSSFSYFSIFTTPPLHHHDDHKASQLTYLLSSVDRSDLPFSIVHIPEVHLKPRAPNSHRKSSGLSTLVNLLHSGGLDRHNSRIVRLTLRTLRALLELALSILEWFGGSRLIAILTALLLLFTHLIATSLAYAIRPVAYLPLRMLLAYCYGKGGDGIPQQRGQPVLTHLRKLLRWTGARVPSPKSQNAETKAKAGICCAVRKQRMTRFLKALRLAFSGAPQKLNNRPREPGMREALAPLTYPLWLTVKVFVAGTMIQLRICTRWGLLWLKVFGRSIINTFNRVPDGPEAAHRTVARRQRVPTLADLETLPSDFAGSGYHSEAERGDYQWLGFFTRPAPVLTQSLLVTERR